MSASQRLREAAERSRARNDELSQRCDATRERAEQITDALRRKWQRRAHATQGRTAARAGDDT